MMLLTTKIIRVIFMAETLDSKTLKALSSETRQEIIKYLAKRPYTASEMSKITKKHVATITEHLDTLEKSGLGQKKEGKKWVYYNLSEKGEKLLKPQYYSWVVVLSLSLLAFFLGAQQFVQTQMKEALSQDFVSEVAGKSAMAATEAVTAQQPITPDYSFFIGSTFILLAAAGFTFLFARWYKYYRMLR